MRLRFILIPFILFCCFPGIGQIDQKIEEIIDQDQSDQAQFGISVRKINGTEIYQHASKSKMTPASTLKLITSFCALELLGSDYVYDTRIGYSGTILSDGTLEGNLYIIGSGDPTFGSPEYPGALSMDDVMNEIKDAVVTQGIKCIDGMILVDDSIFDKQAIHPSWSWDDLTNYYASGAWGYNVHENFYYLYFKRSLLQGEVTIIEQIKPFVPFMTMSNEVTIGPKNSGDNAYLFGHPYTPERTVVGTIPPGTSTFSIKGALYDPGLFGSYHLYKKLETAGISAQSYGTRELGATPFKVIKVVRSPSLLEMVAYANTISNNLFCEAFLKTIGSFVSGSKGSFSSGISAIEKYLEDRNIDIRGWHQEDGSGLSARNRISPDFMTEFINAQRMSLGDSLVKEAIPKVGEKGSVRNFLYGYDAQNSAWLKSGSINGVLAYAGILETKSGNALSIAIMANGHSNNQLVRRQFEKIIEVIYNDM